ncbi:MAG: hypothetical protein A2007_00450 [Verrucomicrobia bacterium GWC2_42_7]|nr:MAG: hypothetical protein A2007_00450 [Verrucomicrobia bacterium GWC2_42_7]
MYAPSLSPCPPARKIELTFFLAPFRKGDTCAEINFEEIYFRANFHSDGFLRNVIYSSIHCE